MHQRKRIRGGDWCSIGHDPILRHFKPEAQTPGPIHDGRASFPLAKETFTKPGTEIEVEHEALHLLLCDMCYQQLYRS